MHVLDGLVQSRSFENVLTKGDEALAERWLQIYCWLHGNNVDDDDNDVYGQRHRGPDRKIVAKIMKKWRKL